MKDFEEYNWEGITYPKGYLEVLFGYAKGMQPKEILEIGMDQGASALALLRGAQDAKLLSVDIYPCQAGNERVMRDEVASRFTFVEADSREYLKKLPVESFDLIYIDGDHLYDVVKSDLQLAFLLIKKGGVILVDDCVQGHQHFGVWQAVTEFCAGVGCTFRILSGSPSSIAEIKL